MQSLEAVGACPDPSCAILVFPCSASSSACSPRGRLAPEKSWMRMMGTSIVLFLLQSEFKLLAFLSVEGMHGRLEACERKPCPGAT